MEQLLFKHSIALMYRIEVELLLAERIGKDLKDIVFSFLKEDPEPFLWGVEEMHPFDPWDSCTAVDACDGIDLPLFAP